MSAATTGDGGPPMSAATIAPAAVGRVDGGPLTGTGRLIRFNLRRDRIRLPAWLAGIVSVQVAGAAAYPDLYPTAADRQTQADIIGGNPAMKAMTGPGYGLDDYTFGAMMTNEYLGFMVIFVALMSVFMVVRHTRAEEETGRAELVRANVVGRHAHLAAALATATLASAAVGGLIAVGMASLGIDTVDWPGSLAFGAAYTVVGLVFAAVAAVTAQLTEYARAASGIAGGLIALAYGVRAVGDVADNGLSWASPIGWSQAAAPYVLDRWWPLLLAAAVAAALAAVAFVLSGRRDVGAGLRAGRPGAAEAGAALATPLGFAWRLQRAGALWWGIGMLLFGAGYGSAANVIEQYRGNEVIREMTESLGGATLTESWLSIIVAVLAIVCTVFAVIAALRPRREESAGRAELALSTALSRTRWVATHTGIALVGGLALLLAAGLGLGGGAAAVTGDAAYVGKMLGAIAAYAPALWVTAGLAVALYGLAPRAVGVAWALLGYTAFVVYFGPLLELPAWMMNLSPYTHVPRMPADDFAAVPLVILTGVAAALVAAGLAAFRHRNLEAT